MRWINLAIIVFFVAAAIIFAFENLETVSVSFLGFGVRAPMAILVSVIYVLGTATGGSLFALLRSSYQGSRARVPSGQ
jgi:lipopolysaccharide assembly protein A